MGERQGHNELFWNWQLRPRELLTRRQGARLARRKLREGGHDDPGPPPVAHLWHRQKIATGRPPDPDRDFSVQICYEHEEAARILRALRKDRAGRRDERSPSPRQAVVTRIAFTSASSAPVVDGDREDGSQSGYEQCSFCGKSRRLVAHLITAENVAICDEMRPFCL